jgi:hypothetical protein
MHGEFDTGERDDLFEEITVANVEDLRDVRYDISFKVTFRDSYLPEGIRLGTIYFQGTSRQVREAIATEIPELLRRLEAGIPEARRASLSPYRDGDSVPGAPMAKPSVVRSSGQRR